MFMYISCNFVNCTFIHLYELTYLYIVLHKINFHKISTTIKEYENFKEKLVSSQMSCNHKILKQVTLSPHKIYFKL